METNQLVQIRERIENGKGLFYLSNYFFSTPKFRS